MATIDQIREAVNEWFLQEFAQGSYHLNFRRTENGVDIFDGNWWYEYDIRIEGRIDGDSYILTDTLTTEYIKFGPNDIKEIKTVSNTDEVIFESDTLDELYDEFVRDITDLDYDIYHKVFDKG